VAHFSVGGVDQFSAVVDSKKEMLVVSWNNFDEFLEDGNATILIDTICELVQHCHCEEHSIEALCKLDFSSLSDVTAEDSCQH